MGKLPDAETEIDAYLRRRLEWGIPEGEDEIEGQIPLNMNGDIMNGISFDKGILTVLGLPHSKNSGAVQVSGPQ